MIKPRSTNYNGLNLELVSFVMEKPNYRLPITFEISFSKRQSPRVTYYVTCVISDLDGLPEI